MLSVKYCLILPQQAYNILLILYCLDCSTFDVPQVSMCEIKTKFKIENLKFIMCISFNKVSPVQLIMTPRIKVHLSQGDRCHPCYRHEL